MEFPNILAKANPHEVPGDQQLGEVPAGVPSERGVVGLLYNRCP